MMQWRVLSTTDLCLKRPYVCPKILPPSQDESEILETVVNEMSMSFCVI